MSDLNNTQDNILEISEIEIDGLKYDIKDEIANYNIRRIENNLENNYYTKDDSDKKYMAIDDFNNKTAYIKQGSDNTVPQITTNNFGQVIKIEEVPIKIKNYVEFENMEDFEQYKDNLEAGTIVYIKNDK